MRAENLIQTGFLVLGFFLPGGGFLPFLIVIKIAQALNKRLRRHACVPRSAKSKFVRAKFLLLGVGGA